MIINEKNGEWFMNNFNSIYPDAEIYQLHKTFRCSQSVVDKSNKVSYNIDKTTAIAHQDIVGEVHVHPIFLSNVNEVNFVIKKTLEYYNQAIRPSIKILYRTNAQSLRYQFELIQRNIPYTIKESCNLFNHKEMQAAFDVCELILNNETNSYQKIVKLKHLWNLLIAYPSHYDVSAIFMKSPNLAFNMSSVSSHTDKLFKVIDSFDKSSISAILTSFAEMIDNYSFYDYFNDSAVDNLICASDLFIDCKTIKECQSVIDKITVEYDKHRTGEAISLSSIHGSKGLEADIVFLVGVNDDMFPHKLNEHPREEVNLLYVAMTRARDILHITGSKFFGTKTFLKHSFIDWIGE